MQLKLNKLTKLKYFKTQAMLASISVIIFALIALLLKTSFSNSSFSKNRTEVWKNANEIAPSFLIKKVVAFNFAGKTNEKSIKVMQIPSQGAGHLYIFDFRSPRLCGIGGCLYLVYHESGKLLLSLLANPNLPLKEEVIRTSNTIVNEFPCLVITQPMADNMVSRSQYCYQSERFIRFNETFFDSE